MKNINVNQNFYYFKIIKYKKNVNELKILTNVESNKNIKCDIIIILF